MVTHGRTLRWALMASLAAPLLMGQGCPQNLAVPSPLSVKSVTEGIEDQLASAQPLTAYDGDWASDEFKYAIRVSDRIGVLTVYNTGQRKIGDATLAIVEDREDGFAGRWMFSDKTIYTVEGYWIDENTIRLVGGGWDWSLTRPPRDRVLTVSVEGQGNVTPNGGSFRAGEQVTLTAIPADGWRFDHWDGALSGGPYDHWRDQTRPKANPGTLTMDGDKSVVAGFEQRQTGAATFDLGNGVMLEVLHIEGGSFMMGSSDEERALFSTPTPGFSVDFCNEVPPHSVTLSAFAVGKTEVTQGQFRAVMGYVPTIPTDCQLDCTNGTLGDELPVVWVTWYEAVAFCDALSTITGRLCRLPTEAEWEYACRAGTTTAFSCGDDEDCLRDYAWYLGDSGADKFSSREVATRSPNPWGLYDMHGNVWEWTGDWPGTYSPGQQVDPTGPAAKEIIQGYKIGRGGAMNRYPNTLRSAYRYVAYRPDWPVFNFGFRVACE